MSGRKYSKIKNVSFSDQSLLRENSVVKEIIYNEETKKAIGVKIIDAISKVVTNYYAKIIFLHASVIATASILLNSVSKYFPNGLGNSSLQVVHSLMGHVVNEATRGKYNGLLDKYYEGRSPETIYIPRFQNLKSKKNNVDFIRGYVI
ncbi:MAG: choline dehydrogenase-like flavoprotein [Sediminicola sp.]